MVRSGLTRAASTAWMPKIAVWLAAGPFFSAQARFCGRLLSLSRIDWAPWHRPMLARMRLTGNRPFTIYPPYCPAGDGGALLLGGVPEWLKGTDCKSVGFAYAGSN